MNANLIISKATKNNWKRLNVKSIELNSKLTSRANKTLSSKIFIPTEYFKNKENLPLFAKILEKLNDINSDTEVLIYNLTLNLLRKNGFITLENNEIYSDYPHLKTVLFEFKTQRIIKKIIDLDINFDEYDILGLFYQSLTKEGDKNVKGSYYTPKKIIDYILSSTKVGAKYLDPCCGTGSFLLKIADIIDNPENIYGVDSDRIACIIAKINLIMKFKNKNYMPNIFYYDFLDDGIYTKLKTKFDIIVTNPPWGAKGNNKHSDFPDIKSGESYSFFIVQAKKLLNKNGILHFVLPESVLNVKIHMDIRDYILNNYSICEIKTWGHAFKNVLTNVITMKLSNLHNKNNITNIINGNIQKELPQIYYQKTINHNFILAGKDEIKLISKIISTPHQTLSKSEWGLGIVTGNNSKHLSLNKDNSERIFTGKDVKPYILEEAKNYIKYKRTSFQQVAPDYIYRATEKLIYKFVSKDLIFAYDNTKSLVLNSANILIPKVKTHSVKTVMAFLNSELFNYLYKTMFNEIKILKGNLITLPFPELDIKTKILIETLVDTYISSIDKKYLDMINETIYGIFGLSNNEVILIKNNMR